MIPGGRHPGGPGDVDGPLDKTSLEPGTGPETLRGIAGSPGLAIGKALVLGSPREAYAHRLIEPREVADTVMWLCRPGSESVTGQSIVLAGGEVT